MLVGREWIVDASGCNPAALRSLEIMQALLGRVIGELELRPIGEPRWHAFPGEGGVTGLALLSESHLACHTYPEFGIATFNLYCCRERPEWPWDARLHEALGATHVAVRRIDRSIASLAAIAGTGTQG